MAGFEAEELSTTCVALTPEQEEREKKTVGSLVSAAIMNASVHIESRGLNKYLLPGLWHCAMTVLFSTLETPEEIMELFDAQHSLLKGTSDNANVPPKKMSDQVLANYTKQTALAAETLMDRLTEAYERAEELEIDEWFPAMVLHTAVTVLLSAWGVDHVKRAITEQYAWLVQGRHEIRNFIEPARYATVPRKVQAKNVQETVKAAEHSEQLHVKKRPTVDRNVTAYIKTNSFDNGRTAWVIVMRMKFADGRFENREIFGVLGDVTGNKSRIRLAHEFALALLKDDGKADVELKMTDSNLLRALPVEIEGANDWNKFESQDWDDVKLCFERNTIRYKIVDTSLVDELQGKADIIIRSLEN